jgi:hypothetical protein
VITHKIIKAENVGTLPPGSVILNTEPGCIALTRAASGRWIGGGGIDLGSMTLAGTYHVLYVSQPAVGCEIVDVTPEWLDSLPVGIVLRDADGDIAVKPNASGWTRTGSDKFMYHADLHRWLTAPVRVLYVPEEEGEK